jgi:hypothetical protein
MNQWMSQTRSAADSITRNPRAVGGSAYAPLPSLAKRRAVLAGAVTLAGIVLFFCYLRLSRTFLLESDGASVA